MSQALNEITLLEGVRNGEETAVRHLFDLHYRPLCYFAEKLTGDKAEAQDVAVNVFLKLLQKKDDFDHLYEIKAFLYTATRNACIDLHRQKKRQERSHEEIQYLLQPDDDADDLQLIDAEIMQRLFQEIESLPPQCSKVFKLIFVSKLDTGAIARQMKISPKTVLNQKAKAVRLLRAALLKGMSVIIIFQAETGT
nr:sigma-70 family RNA polymerase sigma factor [uncultured Chitinophaga sp.]